MTRTCATLFEYKQMIYHTTELKSRAVSVLLYLVDRADKKGFTCFPSLTTIGKNLNISISTVKRAMKELVEKGYLEKEARFSEQKNGGQTSNLYTLRLPKEKVEEEVIEELESVEESELLVEITEVEGRRLDQERADSSREVTYITFENLKQEKLRKEKSELDNDSPFPNEVIEINEKQCRKEKTIRRLKTREAWKGKVCSIWDKVREKVGRCREQFVGNGRGRGSN